MGRLRRSGICTLALMAGSAALQFEPTVLRDFVAGNGSRHIAVGAVRVPLWSAAFAQSPETFSLENVSFTFGGATYEAKRIEFSGVTSSRAEIEALFSSASTEPLANRLARINAKKAFIPEARAKQQLGKDSQTVVYRNIALNDIAQGRIASLTVEATGVETTGGRGNILLSYGQTSISELDLQALANLFETKADTASAPLTRIYATFAIDGIDIVESNEGINLKIGRISARDVMARPTKDSWAGTLALFAEHGGKADPTEEDAAQLLPAFADFMGAFDIGLVEATGIELKTNGKPQTGSKNAVSPASAHINRIAYTGGMASQPPDARVEGVEIGNHDNHVRIGSLSLTGFSLEPTLNGLRGLEGKRLNDLDPATLRSLVPILGTLRLSGFDIDAASQSEKGKQPERIKASLKDFEFTADKPVNAVPTNIRIGAQNFAMALPSNSTDDGIKELLALGYKAIDMSLLVAANWNEVTNEVSLKEVSIQGQDMGSVSLTGVLSNVTRDAFNADTAIAAVSVIGAKAKTADIVVENKGLFERYLARTAKEQKTTPEALRRMYASATAFALPALIGNSDQTKTLSQAIARFIAQPGRLTITAQAKDAAGLGLMDVMGMTDPKAALEKLNITAKAE